MVPMMEQAYFLAEKADYFVVIGTSLAVYPAAGLIDYTPNDIPKYLIDPSDVKVNGINSLKVIKEKASIGMSILANELLKL
jgi:NAD-dependent deacetylase